MQEPQFYSDLLKRIDQESPALPPLPKKILKKKVPLFFKKGLLRSGGLHLAILLALPLWSLVNRIFGWEAERQALLRESEMKTAIRVDVVDLPSLTLQELANVNALEDVGTEPSPKAKDVMIDRTKEIQENKLKEKSKQELEEKRLAQIRKQRLEDLQERMKADTKRKAALEKLQSAGRDPLAGNVKSEGYSISGDIATRQDAYNAKARAHLQRQWQVPEWMQASGLKARILVKIASNGRVVERRFLVRSGNPEFDRYVEEAIELSDPFPKPPGELQRVYAEEGIEWGFPK